MDKIEKEEPCRRIPDGNFYVILDREPKFRGHMLVISKSHIRDITELTDEGMQKQFVQAIVRFARLLKEKLGAEKVYVITMCEHWEEEDLGSRKSSEHLHFHLVPRYKEVPRELRGEAVFLGKALESEKNPTCLQKVKEQIMDC